MRIAMVWPEGATFPDIVTDGDVEVFSISDSAPGDRIYKMGASAQRLHPLEFDALLSTGPIHQAGDKPVVEQAIRAMPDRRPDGKPNLKTCRIIGDETLNGVQFIIALSTAAACAWWQHSAGIIAFAGCSLVNACHRTSTPS